MAATDLRRSRATSSFGKRSPRWPRRAPVAAPSFCWVRASATAAAVGVRKPSASRPEPTLPPWPDSGSTVSPGLSPLVAEFSWSKIPFPSWLRYLHFHEIKSWMGLSTASLIAFVIGIGCIAGALLVGLLDGKKLCRLAGDPVLPRGMAAGGDGLVRGRNPAEDAFRSRPRLTLPADRKPCNMPNSNARSPAICGLLRLRPEPAARFCWLMR